MGENQFYVDEFSINKIKKNSMNVETLNEFCLSTISFKSDFAHDGIVVETFVITNNQ